MAYRNEVWSRTYRRWLHETRVHLTWHLIGAVGGAVAGFFLSLVLNVPTLSIAEWAYPTLGAVFALAAWSVGRFALLRAREPKIIYDELRLRIEACESRYRTTHPNIQVTLENLGDTISLRLENTGAAAAFTAKLLLLEGPFQPAVGSGPFFCRWPDGKDQMLIPKGASHSLRIARLERLATIGLHWTLHYFDHGALKEARLFYLPNSSSSPAVVDIELISHPESQEGSVHKRIAILGDRYHELDPAAQGVGPAHSL
jgi:hypothetical protein